MRLDVDDPMLHIRDADLTDSDEWLAMRCELWPEDAAGEHRAEITRYFTEGFMRIPQESWGVLLAVDADGRYLGFAELSIRPYAEGCITQRVAYLEGWFVRESARKRGIGRALINAAEDWGRSHGCSEFASDARPWNAVSIAAHRAVGFEDVREIRCFRKLLETQSLTKLEGGRVSAQPPRADSHCEPPEAGGAT